MPSKRKKIKGGTEMYCPKCKKITICSAMTVSQLSFDGCSSQRICHTEYDDLQWFRRGRECQACGHQFLTAEIIEDFIDELADARSHRRTPNVPNETSDTGFIATCPQCATKVRIPNRFDGRIPICPSCKFGLVVRIDAVSTDPYKVIGVPQGSNFAEVRSAFRRLMNLYHPDKVNQCGPELRNLANEISQRINIAYDELRGHAKNP